MHKNNASISERADLWIEEVLSATVKIGFNSEQSVFCFKIVWFKKELTT